MPHPARAPQADRVRGAIKRLVAENAYGFIGGEDGVEYFFHRAALAPGVQWENLTPGVAVMFTPRRTDKGWRAIDVTASV